MFEGLGTFWTRKLTSVLCLLVPDEVLLGVKLLPTVVTGVATHLMDPLLVLTEALGPMSFVVTRIT